jgi:hypothetical protein
MSRRWKRVLAFLTIGLGTLAGAYAYAGVAMAVSLQGPGYRTAYFAYVAMLVLSASAAVATCLRVGAKQLRVPASVAAKLPVQAP